MSGRESSPFKQNINTKMIPEIRKLYSRVAILPITTPLAVRERDAVKSYPNYFPMQKVEKMRVSISSVVVSPVICPR